MSPQQFITKMKARGFLLHKYIAPDQAGDNAEVEMANPATGEVIIIYQLSEETGEYWSFIEEGVTDEPIIEEMIGVVNDGIETNQLEERCIGPTLESVLDQTEKSF